MALSLQGTFILVVIGLLFASFPPCAYAQNPGLMDFERSRYATGGVFDYTEDSDLTITTSATGLLRFPGSYTIKQGTTLRELFAYAGGPVIMEKDNRIRRTIYVTLSRPLASRETQVVFEQAMQETIEPLHTDMPLADGDVLSVYIETRQLFRWQNAFTAISTSAAVATLLLTAFRR